MSRSYKCGEGSFEIMANSWLKRGLPFLLTFVCGAGVATLFQSRDQHRISTYLVAGDSYARHCPNRYGRAYDNSDVPVRAHILAKPEAAYTQEAVRSGVTGNVVLRLELSADGFVRDVEVLEGLPDGLTEEAVKAARRIEFTPAMKDGHAVSQVMRVTYNFNLWQ
jgi:TonB family protein